MAFNNVILLSQLAASIVTLILSLCITIPMSIHQDDFRGHCLLFSTGTWREADGQFDVSWAGQSFCNYTIFVGVILFIASAIQIYRFSVLMYKGVDSTFLSAFMDVVFSVLLSIMTVIAALIITLGFDFWCRSITERFETCEDAADNDIDKKDKIDTTSFYIQIGTAQFGAWASFSTTVGLCVFSTLKLCRYHQQDNMKISMARARERLIQDRNRKREGKLEEITNDDIAIANGGDSIASSSVNSVNNNI